MTRNIHSVLQQHPYMYMHWGMILPETNVIPGHFLPREHTSGGAADRINEHNGSATMPAAFTFSLDTGRGLGASADGSDFSPAMFENLQEAIYRSTPEGKVLFANKTFREIFGISTEEDLMNVSARSLFARKEDRDNLWDYVQTARSLKGMEIPFKRKNGTTFWGLVSARLTNGNAGNQWLDIAIVDISSQKEHEQNLRKTKEELDQFVYRASHDLRSPLTSMLGLIDLLKMPNNPEHPRVLEMMERTVLKLDAVIHEITDYSYNASTKLESEAIDIRQLIEESFEKINYLPQASCIDKRIFISLPNAIRSDTKRLRIVLNNLISNAVVFYNPYTRQPYVEVRVSGEGSKLIIEIADNGVGIDPKLHTRIFEMFFRGSALSKGSGLGLYVTKEIVEKLKGSISVSSKPGSGSVFRIALPGQMEIH